jgi:hypothetical protein
MAALSNDLECTGVCQLRGINPVLPRFDIARFELCNTSPNNPLFDSDPIKLLSLFENSTNTPNPNTSKRVSRRRE